jgi:hypothetical protein
MSYGMLSTGTFLYYKCTYMPACPCCKFGRGGNPAWKELIQISIQQKKLSVCLSAAAIAHQEIEIQA